MQKTVVRLEPGQVVHVRGVAAACVSGEMGEVPIVFHSASRRDAMWIRVQDVVYIEPRLLTIGDHVRSVSKEGTSAHMQRMEVVGIKGTKAWCQSGGYDYIRDVSELERVP